MIRNATSDDARAIAEIYNHYIKNTIITFEELEISPSAIAERIRSVTSKNLPWIVAEWEGEILGYAYVNTWKERSAYRFTLESTVYLARQLGGQGLGTELYSALIERVRESGYHSLIGVIALPNAASVALHEKLGFEQVAILREVGTKFGQWIDVGNWQLLLRQDE